MSTKPALQQPSVHGNRLGRRRRRLGRPARIVLAVLFWPPIITMAVGAVLTLAGF